MSKFKVGDRVAVYFTEPSQAMPKRITGKIAFVFEPAFQYPPNFDPDGAAFQYPPNFDPDGEDCFQVEPDRPGETAPAYIHPKQCRKLVKKPRRRAYLVIPTYGVNSVSAWFDQSAAQDYRARNALDCSIVEYAEVRRKK